MMGGVEIFMADGKGTLPTGQFPHPKGPFSSTNWPISSTKRGVYSTKMTDQTFSRGADSPGGVQDNFLSEIV